MVKGASSSFPILMYEKSPPASTSTNRRMVTERRCRKYLISFMMLTVSLDFYFHTIRQETQAACGYYFTGLQSGGDTCIAVWQ